MTQDYPITSMRSYGCSMACGNPYDYVVVDISDGTSQFLCVPCFIKIAADMIKAITDDDGTASAALAAMVRDTSGKTAPGPSGRPRGRNAPAGIDDLGLFDAFDATITPDELPEEFR